MSLIADTSPLQYLFQVGQIDLLPALFDLTWLRSFLEISPQSKAVRALRDALRTKRRRN